MTDWKQVADTLNKPKAFGAKFGLAVHAIRLCTAASRLPSGVDPVKVLEELATTPAERWRKHAETIARPEHAGTCFTALEDCGHCDYCQTDDLI
jgi:hypothetical protein